MTGGGVIYISDYHVQKLYHSQLEGVIQKLNLSTNSTL